MKNTIRFAALFGGAFLLTANLAAAESAPKILRAEGEVSVRSSGSDAWRKAETGEPLPQGAEIRVEPDAECDVRFEGDPLNVVSLRGGSEAVIASVNPPVMDLKDGKIFALLNGLKPGSVFKVRSAVATAAARGTGWSQTSGGEFSSFVDSIQIETPSGATLDLDAGLGVEVGDDGNFGDTHEVSDEERNEFDGWTDEANEAADSAAADGGSGDDGGGGGESGDEGSGESDEESDSGDEGSEDTGGGDDLDLNDIDGSDSGSDSEGSSGSGGGDSSGDSRSEGQNDSSFGTGSSFTGDSSGGGFTYP